MEFDSFDIDVKQPSPAGQCGPGVGQEQERQAWVHERSTYEVATGLAGDGEPA